MASRSALLSAALLPRFGQSRFDDGAFARQLAFGLIARRDLGVGL